MLKNNKTSIYSIVLLCFKYLKNKKRIILCFGSAQHFLKFFFGSVLAFEKTLDLKLIYMKIWLVCLFVCIQ